MAGRVGEGLGVMISGCRSSAYWCLWVSSVSPPPRHQQLTEASIFTGEEELFAFDRTVSRLAEMQTAEYWARWEQTAA